MDTKVKSFKNSNTTTNNGHQTASSSNTLKRSNFKSISRRGTGYFASKSWKKDPHKNQKSIILKHIKTKPKTSKTEVPTSSSMCRPGTLYSDVLFGRKTVSTTSPLNSLRAARSLTSLVTPINVDTKLHTHYGDLESTGKIMNGSNKSLKKLIKSKSGGKSMIRLINKTEEVTPVISIAATLNDFKVSVSDETLPDILISKNTIENEKNTEYDRIDRMLQILKSKVGCQLNDDSFQFLNDDFNIFQDLESHQSNFCCDSNLKGYHQGENITNVIRDDYTNLNSVQLLFQYSFDDLSYRTLEEKAIKYLEDALEEAVV